MRAVSLIEPLEDRIAPASVTLSNFAKTATYTDATGDTVQVTTSKGTFSASQFNLDAYGDLTELNIASDHALNGANITVTVFPVVSPGTGSSSTVDIGYIDATGISLGSVTIPGDLGHIDVGGGSSALALSKLTVNSLGAFGETTGVSNIYGTIGTLNVAGNLEGTLFAQNYSGHLGTGNIGHLNVGGSIDGGLNSAGRGDVFFTGTLGTAIIGGGIEGGSTAYSGSIGGYDSINSSTNLPGGLGTVSKIGSITVNGSVPDDPNPSALPGVPGTSILGGAGNESGSIVAAHVGSVTVAGDVYGGTGTASGAIQGGLSLGKVTINGSLIGGNFTTGNPTQADLAGIVFGGKIGSVLIGSDIYGGSGIDSGKVFSSGTIQKVVVMGDVIGGTAGTSASGSTTSGTSGAISGNALGKIVIEGSLKGGNMVLGDTNQTGDTDGAVLSGTTIGSLYIGGGIIGGSGPNSGYVSTESGGIGTLVVAGATGDIQGGSGRYSGAVFTGGPVGKLTLAQNLTGGSGSYSGTISVTGQLSSLTISGNVTGGTGDDTGTISVLGLLKRTSIAGNVQGSTSGATMLTNTGYIQANGIGNMVIGGSLISGAAGSGGLDTSGAIRSADAIGSISLGAIIGNATNPAIVSAVGQSNFGENSTSDLAIGRITVGKSGASPTTTVALYADILAGYSTNTNNGTDPLGTGVSAGAQIGAVQINGSIEATNIIAGVGTGSTAYAATGNTGFGTAGNTALSGSGVADFSVLSKISQIIVTGKSLSTSSTTNTYGIAADYIAKASIDGSVVALMPGPDNDTFATFNDHVLAKGGDTFLYEV
jgi:hypothetical protein